ncbi:MAG TPA: hypothetical protein VKU41_33190 [Polyangiaceae bacterium]|nr:hypothetical protein [Polyangiaceae bacterium]
MTTRRGALRAKKLLASWILLGCVACSRGSPPSSEAPPAASSAVAGHKESFGSVMAQVGRRFELSGRAAAANRFALAAFEVGELEELFESDVPQAELPKEGPTAHIPAMAKAFLDTNAHELEKTAASRDLGAFKAAFERAAMMCNACHRASAKSFIRVPTEVGKGVPDLEPVVGADAEVQ